jgi:hypothetical protein
MNMSKRIQSKAYLEWVATLPCIGCEVRDGTVVAHHLKGRAAPLSGGMGYKASDWLTMPLCFQCHTQMHSGDAAFMDWQENFILRTLNEAFNQGIIEI